MQNCVHLWYLAHFLFQTKAAQKIKTHIFCSTNSCSENRAVHDKQKSEKKCGTARQVTDNIIRRIRAACWITEVTGTHSEWVILLFHGNNGYANALRLCVHCLYRLWINTPWTRRAIGKKINIQGYCRLNTTIWSDTYKYVNYIFRYLADRASQYIYLNINQLDALNFIISLFHASTCFEHHVLINSVRSHCLPGSHSQTS